MNPNWPVVDEAVSFQTGPSSSWPPKYWVSTSDRTVGTVSITRGRQYELDQVQTGEYHCTWDNRDGALDPTNTASPFSPNVVPYRAFRRRHQWPPTQNMLTIDQATGGSTQASGSTADTVIPGWISYLYYWKVTSEADAYTGPNVFQQVVTAAPSAGSPMADINGWSVKPGQWHSGQVWLRAIAGGTSPQGQLVWVWRDANGYDIGEVSGTAVTLTANSRAWQQVTVSAKAPANAVGGTLQIRMANSVAATWEASGLQVEYAAAPTAWTQPGTWYSLFTGWVERWPQTWDASGLYSQCEPVIVDSLGYLSQSKLKAAFYHDVLALNPTYFYPLDDPKGAAVFKDLTGTHLPAKQQNSPQGPGTITAGNGVQNASATWTTLGMPGPVVTMSNPDTGPSSTYEACSWIDLTTAGITGPPTSGGWTRMIAFRNSGAGPTSGTLWGSAPDQYSGLASLFYVGLGSGASPGLSIQVAGPAGGNSYWSAPTGNYADNNWHLLIISLSADGKTLTVWVDVYAPYTGTTTADMHPSGHRTDMIGAYAYPRDGQYYNGYNGDVAFVAEFPFTMTSTQMTNLSNSWSSAWQGERSDTRYNRVLGYAGYTGPQALSRGATQDMGPATDLPGTDSVTCLQNVVTSENGFHFVKADGTIHFEARTDRYNSLTPVVTFGENPAEWPYEKFSMDNDPTRVANDIQITQNQTNQLFVAQDTQGSAKAYGLRTFQRTINVSSALECQDAANYLYNRYESPSPRVKTIEVHPAALPALWPAAMSCELSTRVRAMRRPLGRANPIQFDGFIEKLTWTLDKDLEARLALEVSPADLNTYWLFSALHTTLSTQATAGQNTAVCTALPDAASNPASASFPNGLQVTLEPGTARAETLLVNSFSATSPGYTTFTMTFNGNLAYTHPAGSMVCEWLPAGSPSPTTWDPVSVLGSTTTLAY